jgi:parallel beta-helix repeat protein
VKFVESVCERRWDCWQHEQRSLRPREFAGKIIVALLLVCGCPAPSKEPRSLAEGVHFPAVIEPSAPGAVDYYVSPTGNDMDGCTVGSPCKTINGVNSRLSSTLPLGENGTTVHVAPGLYAVACSGCGGAIITDKSGTSSARIRYISDRKWAAKIVTTGGSSSWNNRGSYVDIVGFDISGDGPFGIENNSSAFSRMLGNNIHHIHLTGVCSAGAGIVMAHTTSDQEAIGNWVHHIGDMNIRCNQVHGIYVAGPRAHIVNNITNQNMGWGIHLWHAATNVVIANNTCFANGLGGIMVGCGDTGCIVNDNTIVNNNIVVENHGYGIMEHGLTGMHNTYNNNLSFNNSAGSFFLQNTLVCMHCVTADPLMVDYRPDGTGDYHLRSGSPAIDAGTSSKAPTTDFDGGLRPVNLWDIGAYENGSTPAASPVGSE